MSHFYFKTMDNDGMIPGDLPLEFPDLFAAVEEAKHVLAEMALDGLPQLAHRRRQVAAAVRGREGLGGPGDGGRGAGLLIGPGHPGTVLPRMHTGS